MSRSPFAPSPHGRTIEQTDWENWHGRKLREAQQTELRGRYGEDVPEPGVPPVAEDVVIFLVAREADGEAVGCGALRQLDGTSGEIKRMYVADAHRGRGISREILAVLEENARSLGWTTLKLETGPLQPEAIALYTSSGYLPVERFGAYADSVGSLCFAKNLPPDRQATGTGRSDPILPPSTGGY